jgi:hypothetical protein
MLVLPFVSAPLPRLLAYGYGTVMVQIKKRDCYYPDDDPDDAA